VPTERSTALDRHLRGATLTRVRPQSRHRRECFRFQTIEELALPIEIQCSGIQRNARSRETTAPPRPVARLFARNRSNSPFLRECSGDRGVRPKRRLRMWQSLRRF
jgi:hypothetical protein